MESFCLSRLNKATKTVSKASWQGQSYLSSLKGKGHHTFSTKYTQMIFYSSYRYNTLGRSSVWFEPLPIWYQKGAYWSVPKWSFQQYVWFHCDFYSIWPSNMFGLQDPKLSETAFMPANTKTADRESLAAYDLFWVIPCPPNLSLSQPRFLQTQLGIALSGYTFKKGARRK